MGAGLASCAVRLAALHRHRCTLPLLRRSASPGARCCHTSAGPLSGAALTTACPPPAAPLPQTYMQPSLPCRRSGQLRSAHRINYDVPHLASAAGVDVVLGSMHELEQLSCAVGAVA